MIGEGGRGSVFARRPGTANTHRGCYISSRLGRGEGGSVEKTKERERRGGGGEREGGGGRAGARPESVRTRPPTAGEGGGGGGHAGGGLTEEEVTLEGGVRRPDTATSAPAVDSAAVRNATQQARIEYSGSRRGSSSAGTSRGGVYLKGGGVTLGGGEGACRPSSHYVVRAARSPEQVRGRGLSLLVLLFCSVAPLQRVRAAISYVYEGLSS
jgi:hypothetical protein